MGLLWLTLTLAFEISLGRAYRVIECRRSKRQDQDSRVLHLTYSYMGMYKGRYGAGCHDI
jgi:hypothetical protein